MSIGARSRNGREPRHGSLPYPPPKLEFPFPPATFDPLSAPAAELRRYGIPERPDAERQPRLLEAWLRLFQRPLTFRRPQPETQDIERLRFIQKPVTQQAFLNQTRIETSANWCGASIVPNGGNRFVLILGEWNVPVPALPPAAEQGRANQRNRYHCSAWIGLDGDRRYRSSTLPQIGTEQILTVENTGLQQPPEYSVWFQWWARDQVKLTRETLTGIAVSGGERVMAAIWVIDPYHVVALFRTFAPHNQITILVRPVPALWLTPEKTSEIWPVISGGTAEWIVERPQTLDIHHPTLELFAKYDPVRFDHCVTGVAPAPTGTTAEETLASARYFRLFEVPRTAPPRIQLISMPSRIDTTSFQVRYGGFAE